MIVCFSKGKLELMRNSERKIAQVAGVKYKEVPHRIHEKSLTFWQSLRYVYLFKFSANINLEIENF